MIKLEVDYSKPDKLSFKVDEKEELKFLNNENNIKKVLDSFISSNSSFKTFDEYIQKMKYINPNWDRNDLRMEIEINWRLSEGLLFTSYNMEKLEWLFNQEFKHQENLGEVC